MSNFLVFCLFSPFLHPIFRRFPVLVPSVVVYETNLGFKEQLDELSGLAVGRLGGKEWPQKI